MPESTALHLQALYLSVSLKSHRCRLTQLCVWGGLVSEGRYWKTLWDFCPLILLLQLLCWYKLPPLEFSSSFHTVPVICRRCCYSPVNWAEIIRIYEMLSFGWVPGKVSKKTPLQYTANKPVEWRCQILISPAIFCCRCRRQNAARAKFQGP